MRTLDITFSQTITAGLPNHQLITKTIFFPKLEKIVGFSVACWIFDSTTTFSFYAPEILYLTFGDIQPDLGTLNTKNTGIQPSFLNRLTFDCKNQTVFNYLNVDVESFILTAIVQTAVAGSCSVNVTLNLL